jgi:S-adenosylmethionine-diacylglycerol 3-amino-3-carboxypropyl transferase
VRRSIAKLRQRNLKNAVHRSAPASSEGILERLFTFVFKGLVYPQIWEDPDVDLQALRLEAGSRVITIASGGCNVLAYLTADPKEIVAVDLNRAHVALTRLKLAAVRYLPSYGAFYRFFGQANDPANLAAYSRFLRPRLDADTRSYWEGRGRIGRQRITLFSRGLYRHGLLGHFIGLAHRVARLHGIDPRRILAASTREEQRDYFERALAPLFDKNLVRWATSKRVSLFGLGIPPAQYAALASAGRGDMALVLRQRLERLACGFPLSDNYFAWQAFGRSYAPQSAGPLPPYLRRENFAAIRARADRVRVLNESLTDFLGREEAGSFDAYVLLDAQDWMTDKQLNALWAEITRTARPGARAIFRTAAEETLLPGRVDESTLGRWSYLDVRSRALSAQDRSAIYGGFHLYVFDG